MASDSFFYTLCLCNAAGMTQGQSEEITRPTNWPFFYKPSVAGPLCMLCPNKGQLDYFWSKYVEKFGGEMQHNLLKQMWGRGRAENSSKFGTPLSDTRSLGANQSINQSINRLFHKKTTPRDFLIKKG